MKNLKLTALAAMLVLVACSNDNGPTTTTPSEDESTATGEVTKVMSYLTIELSTDKACYSPGETVSFAAEGKLPQDAKVRYRHDGAVVAEETLTANTWTWTPPETDFTGYLADVYDLRPDGTEVVRGTIDVSSDWTRFPRYGFVADFDESKLDKGTIEEEMRFLSRCHINSVQFQDWHNKHHWPLGGTREQLEEVYKDIANRDVYTEAVKGYINAQHSLGMKSIFYDLCFGALDDAIADGVKEE